MIWDRYRTDLRSFGRLAQQSIAYGKDSKLARSLLAGDPSIGAVGASLEMLALVILWRVACWPKSTTLVVTPWESQARSLFALTQQMVAEAEPLLADRVIFAAGGKGLSCAASTKIGAVHCSPGTLGRDLPDVSTAEAPLLVLVPSLDLIPGPHLKYAARLSTRKGTTVLVNLLNRGRL